MKLSKKITAILFSALLCAALFAGCVKDTDSDTDSGEPLFTTGEKQTEDPSGYAQLSYDAQTDLYSLPGGQVYRLSGISYEPVAIGQGAAGFGDAVLYTIKGFDAGDYLTEDYDGTGGIFYRADTVLPGLADMHANRAIICVQEQLTLGIGEITDAAVLQQMIDLLKNGKDVGTESASQVYQIKFASEEYPAFYYRVSYFEKADGTRCLYDRDSKKTVDIGDLLSDYIPSSSELQSAVENG
jgi:hypothetical protein